MIAGSRGRLFTVGLAVVFGVAMSGCESAPRLDSSASHGVDGNAPPRAIVGEQTYTLDQLAPAPDDGSGLHLLYAVIGVSTTAARYTVREASFTLLDSAGRSYAPVRASVYVPIDHLDGLTISAGHSGAGTVAFPIPAAAPARVGVTDGAASGKLSAP